MNKHFFSFMVMTALFAAVLVSNSCNKDDDDNNKGYPVSGTLAGDNAGNYTLMSVYFDYDKDGGPVWVATVPVTDGKFNIQLPTPKAGDFYGLDGAPEGVTVSVEGVKCADASFVARVDEDDSWGKGFWLQGESSKGYFFVDYMYVDRDVNITGAYEEEGDEYDPGYRDVYDMKLKTGWNAVVYYSQEETDGTRVYTAATDTIPSGARWIDYR